MRTRLLSLLVFVIIGALIPLQAQTFDKLWNDVKSMEDKGLPQSAIKTVNQIFDKALKEKNSPQMLKAYLTRANLQDAITPDSFVINLEGIRQWEATATAPVDKAILNTLLAKAYANYMYFVMRGSRQNQPALVGEIPANMSEWTSNIFIKKIFEHLRWSLKDKELLQNMSSLSYEPFVTSGKTSMYWNHDIYSLLALQALDILSSLPEMSFEYYPQSDWSVEKTFQPVSLLAKEKITPASDYDRVAETMQIYQSLFSFYLQKGYNDAIVLTQLSYYNSVSPQLSNRGNNDIIPQYISVLKGMIEQYGNQPVCAEVYAALANLYRQKRKLVEAYNTLKEGISRYPNYVRVNMLKNSLNSLTSPQLNARWEISVYPEKDFDLRVNYGNLNGITVRFYRINDAVTGADLANGAYNRTGFMKNSTKLVSTRHYVLKDYKDYANRDTIIPLKAPREGWYMVSIVADNQPSTSKSQLLYVTKLRAITRLLTPDKTTELVVVDNETGHPVSGATVSFYNDKNQLIESRVTDVSGVVHSAVNKKVTSYSLKKGQDRGMGMQWIADVPGDNGSDRKESHLKLFTDRGIYRPGQTVFVKGLAYSLLRDEANVIVGGDYILALYDANGEQLAETKLKTDEFGSFTTQFVLPSVTLNGVFTLRSGDTMETLRVEEYKRPTFDITFQPQKGTFSLGDSVDVQGSVSTFSGVPLTGVKAVYTVKRSSLWWWRMLPREERMIDSGELLLNEKGEFDLSFLLQPGETQRNRDAYYSYTLVVTVTNDAGETQSGETTIMAGTKSVILSVDLPESVCKERIPEIKCFATNLDGNKVALQGQYALWQLPDSVNVLQAEFSSGRKIDVSSWNKMASGKYNLVFTSKDNQGRTVTVEKQFILYSIDDRKLPVETPDWFVQVDKTFAPGKPAVLLFGSSEKDVYAFLDIYKDSRDFETKIIRLDNSVEKITIPYPEKSDNKTVSVEITFVKHGKSYTNSAQIELPLPSKELTMKWDVFRDKLKPGQNETWTLSIKNPDGQPADAQLLASMYDASLDKISPFSWNGNVSYNRSFFRLYRYVANVWDIYFYANFKSTYLKYPSFEYDRMMWLTYNPYSRYMANTRMKGVFAGALMSKEETGKAVELSITNDMAVADVVFQEEAVSVAPQAAKGDQNEQEVRSNFAETAFFYPQLRTNEKGEVSFEFTMPQSLTKWKFMGFANTKDMNTGMLEAYTVTSKEFMIVPNMPRFVRVGDDSSIAASIMNLSDKDITGNVTFELFDPVTEKVVTSQQQPFAVKAGATVAATFSFAADGAYSLLACRMVADGGMFSDGEQRLLPVLSDKVQVTETKAIQVRGEETRKFSLKDLFNNQSSTATDRRLTVEFTGNPAWYAVQALPTLNNPANDNAISWAATYYANSLASYIMKSQPRIKAVFDSWKLQNKTKETLWSNLQKNQELKNILLQESPWVMEAKTEAEQKERLGMLFDLNTISGNNSVAISKLQALQKDGSWSWYAGMGGSRYVTQFVLESFAKLSRLTGETLPDNVQRMQKSAFVYLHAEVLNEYNSTMERLKEGGKDTGINDMTLDYLYLCALASEPIPAANKQAYSYYLKKVQESIAQQTIRQKAMSAVILGKANNVAAAEGFIKSIKEYAVTTDEMGMYFPSVSNAYAWSNLAIPTQTLVIQAMDMTGKNTTDIENLKLWLLKQKQTQAWSSPVATVDAVYALLNKGTNLLESQGDVRITLGNEVLETYAPAKTTVPGLGYIQKTFAGKEIKPNMNTLTVEKRDAGVAWGAVFTQYLENIDKVKSVGGMLKVEKKLYREEVVNGKAELVPITENTLLQVGDKVVARLTVSADADMDFVQLKDERAACFEPQNMLSGYRWEGGLGCYVSVRDASTDFFFDTLHKGTYIVTHSFYVTRAGEYAGGIATLQSAYAPEFVAHSASVKVKVK